MNNKIIFSVIGGMIVGAVCGVLGSKSYYKKKYQDEADKEIKDMEEYYKSMNNYSFPDSEVSDRVDEELYSKESLHKRVESKKEITQYNNMYKKEENSTANLDEDEQEITPEDNANESHEENRNKRPEVISESALGELPPNIDSQSLFLYKGDGTLTDDCDNIVDEPAYLIGRALNNIDLDDCDDPIFILNYELDCCYEIQIIEGNYPGGYVTSLD